tara:strand:- start:2086 stop:2220 length:135 start_codon:yes stop_codon:yes gene_type:complete
MAIQKPQEKDKERELIEQELKKYTGTIAKGTTHQTKPRTWRNER